MPLSNCPDRLDTSRLWALEILAERRIRAGREAGHFDDPGGSGQSVQPRDNPYLERGWQALSGVFEEANLRPTWIEEWQEIRAEILRCRVNLCVTNDTQLARQQVARLKRKNRGFQRGCAVAAISDALPQFQARAATP